MDYELQIIHSRRRSISLEIQSSERVLVRAPNWVSRKQILQFMDSKEKWIQEHLEKKQILEEKVLTEGMISDAEIKKLAEEIRRPLGEKLQKYAAQIGVDYGRVSVRCQSTRWGSCSAKGNLNFNCLLMLAPENVMDYIVVHELCHRKQMNHSDAFWKLVEQNCPDYRKSIKWLKENGACLMARAGRE